MEFNLVFSGYDCVGMAAAFVQLWSIPSHDIRLLSTRQGSVIAAFWVGDGGDGTAAARYTQLSAQLAIPGSADAIRANNLGIPVIRSATVSPQAAVPPFPIGLIVGAAIGGLLLIGVIIFFSIIAVRKCRDNRHSHYSPLLPSTSSTGVEMSAASHDIGAPYGFKHDHGESRATNNLVSRDEFAQRQKAGGGGAAAPVAARAAATPSEPFKRFKLIADIRDVGEGVLTGAKAGTLYTVLEKDLTGQDWIWGTLDDGRSGWLPANHGQPV